MSVEVLGTTYITIKKYRMSSGVPYLRHSAASLRSKHSTTTAEDSHLFCIFRQKTGMVDVSLIQTRQFPA
jgi:hypothetical protein